MITSTGYDDSCLPPSPRLRKEDGCSPPLSPTGATTSPSPPPPKKSLLHYNRQDEDVCPSCSALQRLRIPSQPDSLLLLNASSSTRPQAAPSYHSYHQIERSQKLKRGGIWTFVLVLVGYLATSAILFSSVHHTTQGTSILVVDWDDGQGVVAHRNSYELLAYIPENGGSPPGFLPPSSMATAAVKDGALATSSSMEEIEQGGPQITTGQKHDTSRVLLDGPFGQLPSHLDKDFALEAFLSDQDHYDALVKEHLDYMAFSHDLQERALAQLNDASSSSWSSPLSPLDPIEIYLKKHELWEQDYRQARASRGQLVPRPKYVAYVPDEGFGNRLRGLWSSFMLAMALDRTLLLYWTKPCHWSLQIKNTVPWDWDMEHYPSLMQELEGNSTRALYMCLTQFVPACDDRDIHHKDFKMNDLRELYDSRDVVIIKGPDEFVTNLLDNPYHGQAVKEIYDWDGDKRGRTFMQRFMARVLQPSPQAVEMMAPFTGRFTHAVHVRTHFCSVGGVASALRNMGINEESTVFLAIDKPGNRNKLADELRPRVKEVLYIDLPVVHSNDKLPDGMDQSSFISLIADLFLVSEAPNRVLTIPSSFSQAAQMLYVGNKKGDRSGSQVEWICSRKQNPSPMFLAA